MHNRYVKHVTWFLKRCYITISVLDHFRKTQGEFLFNHEKQTRQQSFSNTVAFKHSTNKFRNIYIPHLGKPESYITCKMYRPSYDSLI